MNVPKWTRERIVVAMQAWAAERGRPPAADEWRVSGLWEHPSQGTVRNVFGSWSAAVVAAGFVPRPRHRPKVAA